MKASVPYFSSYHFAFPSEFSLDSKLLTGVIISLAKTGEDIVDAANLIQVLGKDTINELLKELKTERGE